MSGGLVATGPAAVARGGPAGPEGVWQTVGYGTVLAIEHGRMQEYQTTAISCLKGLSATGGPLRYGAEDGQAFTLLPGRGGSGFRDRAGLHVDGAVGDRTLRRLPALPARCAGEAAVPGGPAQAGDPQGVYDVFWQTFAENYPFFAAKGVDWQAVRERTRPLVRADSSPAELFAVLRGMVEPLHDAHVVLEAPSVGFFAEGRPGTVPPSPAVDDRAKSFVVGRDLAGLVVHEYAAGRISYADLPGGQGYLRISGFGGYAGPGGDDSYQTNSRLLEQALSEVLTAERVSTLGGLILDLRINGGGYDALGLQVAARLTDRPYVAYAKRARDRPEEPSHFTTPQPIPVRPADAPRYTGPLAVLIGGSTVSAGESFTQALLARPTGATLIGQPTQGVFSDTLDRALPNGWSFSLPNEELLTRTGTSYDGPGIPPDISTPVFTEEEYAQGKDSAFDRAVALPARQWPARWGR
ncbi:S41 family peptidase [Kitasatospora sp. MMS16-BH015]|uniref:S41 family peptidase n=1 Tax=Kitasatospora sp. MMS16-BH015 TaxID=2018025 RepID=UPI00352EB0BA